MHKSYIYEFEVCNGTFFCLWPTPSQNRSGKPLQMDSLADPALIENRGSNFQPGAVLVIQIDTGLLEMWV